ncbi:hypothetical protein Y032_0279g1197 [Ancylostoma ceylanicum]|uniref:DDE Tnp4 domain-containing protein n=1 Tax=Ancylostoma ceylanicum TaxID=53326 RepID=A0A016S831_9BILA|nr:hypothetical protein Y032_0279g1197 [Ancylostoma ceylanicum]
MDIEELEGVLEALEALEEVVEEEASTSATRAYVRQEHVAFLETRFRVFDEYLVTRRPEGFLDFIRLLPDEFEDLYERIGGRLVHANTHASPISGKHRLMIFLRFVAEGGTFSSFALDYGCGKQTVSEVVKEVTEAIIGGLYADAFPPLTRRRLEDAAEKTQQRYDYPRAVGFMDGKHIGIKKPARSGSAYWNYQHYYSIILLALCDCDYRIMCFDIGAPGRAGDAGVFRRSAIRRYLDRNDDLFPPTRNLGNVGAVQYHILVDGGFGQGHRFVRPYTQAEASTPEKRRFNSKLSGARRMVESTFGILAQRFQILQTCIALAPERAARLVTSLMILHNLLPRRRDLLRGVNRYPEGRGGFFRPLEPINHLEGSNAAKVARNRICQHYLDKYGPAH